MENEGNVRNDSALSGQKEMEELFSGEHSKEATVRFYRKHAKNYDKFEIASSFKMYAVVAEHTAALLSQNKTFRILDIGAGTGRLGLELKQLGFHNIDALDVSADMLEVAIGNNIYQNYICEYLGSNKLDIKDETYDAIVASGCFSNGQAKQNCFQELIRITKKGSYIVFGVKEKLVLDLPDWEVVIKEHEEKKRWKNIYKKRLDNNSTGSAGIIYVFRKSEM